MSGRNLLRSVATERDPLAAAEAAVKVEGTAYSYEERREAAKVDAVGKYEPKLTEDGIPADVLAKLLPGDDVIELPEPTVAGGLGYRFIKRAFDVVSCGCALVILAVPMGAIALKIKHESPGPVIYAQRRVGKGGKVFNVYKFRSMYIDAEARGAKWARGDDPRVTPFGKIMRKTRMAPVIIGAPGDGEPTKSLSHSAKTQLDQQKCERLPGSSLNAGSHYISLKFSSFALFGHLDEVSRRVSRARAALSGGLAEACSRAVQIDVRFASNRAVAA